MKLALIAVSCCLAVASAQNTGTLTQEQPIALTIQQCTAPGACTNVQTHVVLDSNWRWTHQTSGATNCYTGNTWDQTLCPDPDTCANNCAIDGVATSDWAGTYGITGTSTSVALKFVTHGPFSVNIGSRVYLTDTGGNNYQMFKLLNREFTFDVDDHSLDCGLNGAVYLVEMDADGGLSEFPLNKAGAKYGTGYCDAQCPHDMKWIDGVANVIDWTPATNDANSGKGHYGICCAEMDLWEANSKSQAYTSHPCSKQGYYSCEGIECGDNPDNRYDGVCDKDGCDFASWRHGNQTFFGPGASFDVDSSQPITVVTQFLTVGNTDTGALREIRRIYKQGGRVIQNSVVNIPGVPAYDSITDQFCADTKAAFGDINDHLAHGALAEMGRALGRGMVLVLSLWDDHDANMLWLDSNYPTSADPTKPGVSRGPCPTSSGKPEDVEAQQPDASVRFSNIKFGTIGSTY